MTTEPQLDPAALASLERIRALARERRKQFAIAGAAKPTVRKSRMVQNHIADTNKMVPAVHRGVRVEDGE